eukprot:gene14261-biopygen15653
MRRRRRRSRRRNTGKYVKVAPQAPQKRKSTGNRGECSVIRTLHCMGFSLALHSEGLPPPMEATQCPVCCAQGPLRNVGVPAGHCRRRSACMPLSSGVTLNDSEVPRKCIMKCK